MGMEGRGYVFVYPLAILSSLDLSSLAAAKDLGDEVTLFLFI